MYSVCTNVYTYIVNRTRTNVPQNSLFSLKTLNCGPGIYYYFRFQRQYLLYILNVVIVRNNMVCLCVCIRLYLYNIIQNNI